MPATDSAKSICFGEACHIEAVSPGGKRFNPNVDTLSYEILQEVNQSRRFSLGDGHIEY